jgi:formylglycine-generating enzyme
MFASARPAMALSVVVVGLTVCIASAERRHEAEGLACCLAADDHFDSRSAADDRVGSRSAADGSSAADSQLVPDAPPPAAPPPDDPACPPAMALVEGDYCTDVVENCVEWQDPPNQPFARCARFAPTTCAGKRVRKRFCVDRDEYTAPGEALPQNNVSWTQARQTCEASGKRLCLESEWEFACEGEEMFPYPTGYTRDSNACNFDKEDLVDPATGRLRDMRVPSGHDDRCVSPFGARDMSGNVDEWVWRDRTPGDWRSALKGGWWMPARDRCRPATTAHGEQFAGPQTGFRCCADARP